MKPIDEKDLNVLKEYLNNSHNINNYLFSKLNKTQYDNHSELDNELERVLKKLNNDRELIVYRGLAHQPKIGTNILPYYLSATLNSELANTLATPNNNEKHILEIYIKPNSKIGGQLSQYLKTDSPDEFLINKNLKMTIEPSYKNDIDSDNNIVYYYKTSIRGNNDEH